MTVYWVDPYLNASIGGIHGTVDGTTRNGSYSYPFKLSDVYVNTSAQVTSINGVSLVDGDELRLKGQDLSSYLYNIGSVDNYMKVEGFSGSTMYVENTYVTELNAYRLACSTWGSNKGVFIYSDTDGFYGTDKWFMGGTNYQFNSESSNYVAFYSNYYSPLSGFALAKGSSITSMINQPDKVAWVDPNYFINILTQVGSGNHYAFNLAAGVQVTDGWDSETTRNGVTLLPLMYTSYSSSQTLYFGTYSLGTSVSNNTNLLDLRNTAIGHYSTNYYRLYYYEYYYASGYTGAANSYINIRSWYSEKYNSWPYVYIGNSSSSGGTNPVIKFSFYCKGYYGLYTGGNGSSTNIPKIQVDNYFTGNTGSFQLDYNHWYFGNIIAYQYYTNNLFLDNRAYSGQKIFIDGHIFGYNSVGLASTTDSTYLDLSANSTYPGTAPAAWPSTTGGPTSGGEWLVPQNGFVNTSNEKIKLNPSVWYEVQSINPFNYQSYTYNHQKYTATMPPADVNQSNFRNADMNVYVKNQFYYTNSNFAFQDLTFSSNDYDGKPLAIWTQSTTSTNSAFPALIGYNDAPNEMTVQSSSKATYNQGYYRGFVVEVPDPTLYTNMLFSVEIKRSSVFGSSPYGYIFWPGIPGVYTLSTSNNGNITTLTKSVSASSLDPLGRIAVVKLIVFNGNSYADKHYIRNMSITGS